ncbi:hypothetical protein MMC24_000166 [Lignoscripta atroalba]|nr:hypothetical protein [Lignoscripta atroalba]
MAKSLSESDVASIRESMDSVTADPNKIPGCVVAVVGKDGKPIFTHASGTRGVDTKEPMTMESIFWIASCTKMIGGIAAMQLVEQGKLALDDADMVEKICPELKDIKILKNVDDNGKPEFVDKKKGITLRMLLSHTAGFGYTFFDHNLRRWGLPIGCDELSGYAQDVQRLPLVNEPGTKWQYGVGIDWAGNIVERVSGLSLNDYFQKHIFQPLGIKKINMFPDEQMKSKLAHMHAKYQDGTVHTRDHLLRRPLLAPEDEIKHIYNSAGAGCFARPLEYCEILATLLNDGESPTSGKRILKAETVQEMFTNQIPDFPDFGRQGIPAAKPDYSNPLPDLYPQPPEQAQGWGLTFMLTIHPGATGRGNNTGFWAGLPNLFWWCDREQGVAGIIATQILPFGGTPE